MSSSDETNDRFWADEIHILFKDDRIAEFFPSNDMSLSEKLNSLVRLGLYLSIVVSLYKKDIKFLFIFFLSLGLTYIIYNYSPEEESFTNSKDCIKPTPNNPFMNVLPTDYTDNPNRPPACDINDPEVKKKMNEYFEKGLYKDVNDPFDRNNSQRQFYTMPSTTIPNDQNTFARWLFGQDTTCKDNNDCNPYTDLRNSKPELSYMDRTAEDVSNRFEMLNTRKHPSSQTFK